MLILSYFILLWRICMICLPIFLTSWGWVMHIIFLVAWPALSHYLNQCWNIVNWTIGNKLQWNLNPNLYIFIQENAFEIVIRKLVAILSQPHCVKYSFIGSEAINLKEWQRNLGPVLIWRCDLTSIGNSIMEIRQPSDSYLRNFTTCISKIIKKMLNLITHCANKMAFLLRWATKIADDYTVRQESNS